MLVVLERITALHEVIGAVLILLVEEVVLDVGTLLVKEATLCHIIISLHILLAEPWHAHLHIRV
jgi:hypothetical protein